MMNRTALRENIRDFLEINISEDTVETEVIEVLREKTFERRLIRYAGSEGDEIRAYLFIPKQTPVTGSVLVHHQHNGERHLGKSEVAGIAGDPFQAFCPALAEKGIITLAPDSICFEDRRTNRRGIEPDSEPDNDWLQHYNEMAYRLLKGTTLMKKVLDDSAIGINVLLQQAGSQTGKIGLLGHSYGGNTALFHAPLDERVGYTCSSGAVCSYRTKIKHQTGIELAEVIPGFLENFEIEDLLKTVCPRKFLIVSATEDIYAQDAKEIYNSVKPVFQESNAADALVHREYEGGHPLDRERFDFIVNWFSQEFKKAEPS
ncbi:MAG: dienelactone hydrolase family protein [Pyrinomonadaceae bacterium]